MITVAQALDALFALVAPMPDEVVPLHAANGRVLAKDAVAVRDQPPFAASAMDGYAVRGADVKTGATFDVVGEAAAGHAYSETVTSGQAARIFTGAPMPNGTDYVVIQEDVTRVGDTITVNANAAQNPYVRKAGADFRIGDKLAAPRKISPSDTALLAAMNVPKVTVARKPVVAIIATGDELVQPGESPAPDQIIASNTHGLAALLAANGATPRLLPIARDNHASLEHCLALASDADVIITIGGASVGDHDLVGAVAADMGLDRSFYKVAMRPGKPLMAGRLGKAMLIGLPGNPVSAMVCGHIFVLPVIRAMTGMQALASPRRTATLAHDIAQNGPREHYMRAKVDADGVTIFARQDSALLTVLADANCLAVRAPHAPKAGQGDMIEIIDL